MTKDILLFESGRGGDMKILNNDLSLTENLFQQIYLSLFGGNIESNTKGNELISQERNDYWANELFYWNDKNKQWNSNTERTLRDSVLNSSGRLEILRAIEKDLDYLKSIVDVKVEVQITDVNRVNIHINISGLENQQERILQLIWDNAKSELIIEDEI